MGNTKLLLETVTNFIALSPYKPFGTYVFCTGNGKLDILRNPDAVLQLLFYSSQLCSERKRIDVAQRSLQQHFSYENELKESFNMLDVVLLESLEQLPLSADSTSGDTTTNTTLKDLGLVSSISFACYCQNIFYWCFNKFQNLEINNLFLKDNCFQNLTCKKLYQENRKKYFNAGKCVKFSALLPKNFLSHFFICLFCVWGALEHKS